MKRNLLLGNGNVLTTKQAIKQGRGPKNYPYTIAETRKRLNKQIKNIQTNIQALPNEAKARGESVFYMTLHPAFLGRSYYPNDILRETGLRDVGSRQILITPQKASSDKKSKEKEQVSIQLFISGNESNLEVFQSLLNNDEISKNTQKQFTEIESLSFVNISDKEKRFPNNDIEISFEVVLHARANEEDIVIAFLKYAKKNQVKINYEDRIITGGLTFLKAIATPNNMRKILNFSMIRIVRPMPELRCVQPDLLRKNSSIPIPELPIDGPFQDIKAAIFDGGLGTSDLSLWADEYVYDDTQKTVGNLLSHGNEVTSTFLFGRITKETTKLERPFIGVDHYRVLSPESGSDYDLFDVLNKIKTVLDTGEYKFANLSLGPRLPIDDTDVHVWTAVLDNICAKHGIFLTVAVGNDGNEEGDAARIQPPSDMVNAISVGSADRSNKKWKRASYSCIGPGRSPGFVKPDGLMFGGSESEPLYTYNPLLNSIVGVMGTSYAAPLVLRTAAGVATISENTFDAIALKALLIHHTEKRRISREEVGWGRFVEDPNLLLSCEDDTATVIYQGKLAKGQYLRALIPFPDVSFDGPFELIATLCIQTPTDPEHSVNYTRSGMQVTFRPRMGLDEEDTDEFFGIGSIYKTEQEYRDEGHKWETCLHRSKKFNQTTVLNDPVFDIRYHARDASRGVKASSAPDMVYAMIISVRVKGFTEMYNKIRQRYKVLQPVTLRTEIDILSS